VTRLRVLIADSQKLVNLIVRKGKQPPEKSRFIPAEIASVPQFFRLKPNGSSLDGSERVGWMCENTCYIHVLGKIFLRPRKNFATRTKKAGAWKTN